MKKRLKTLLYFFFILFILVVTSLGFLLSTTPGLYVSAKLANLILPGTITIKKAHGQLMRRVSMEQFAYKDSDQEIIIKKPSLHWHPLSLFKHRVIIKSFTAKEVSVSLTPTPTTTPNQTTELPSLPVDVLIKHLSINKLNLKQGTAVYEFNDIRIEASLKEKMWQITKFNMDYLGLKLSSSLQFSPHYPYSLEASLNLKGATKNGLELEGNLFARGNIHAYHWTGTFLNPGIFKMYGSLKEGSQLDFKTVWEETDWRIDKSNPIQTTAGHLRIQGNLPELTAEFRTKLLMPVESDIKLNVQYTKEQFTAKSLINLHEGSIIGELKYNPTLTPAIQGSVSSEKLNLRDTVYGITNAAFHAQFSGSSLKTMKAHATAEANYLDHPLNLSANFIDNVLKAKIALGKNIFQIKANRAYPWTVYANIPEPELLHPQFKGLNTNLAIIASADGPESGKLQLTLSEGQYQLQNEKDIAPLHFSGGTLTARLNPEGLSAKGLFTIDPQKKFNLSLDLPRFNLQNPIHPKQAIDGQLDLTINSLSFLNTISNSIEKADGELQVHLNAMGTMNHPVLKGTIRLVNGQVVLPDAGLNLNPISATLDSHNNKWQLNAIVYSDKNPLTLKGQGVFSPTLSGDISLTGDTVKILDSNEYKIFASPDLLLHYDSESTTLSGELLIPKATISPHTFSESVTLSDDVVFTHKEEARSFNLNTDLKVIMGQEVRLDTKGLKGKIVGEVHLRQQPQGSLNATGKLIIEQGIYKAYGRELIIEQGELFFTGGLIANPGLNIRAVKRFSNANASFSGSNQLFDFKNANLQSFNYGTNTTVGVQVTGRLTSPKVKLFSTPATLSQADILSMLLLGRPASQADKAGGQILLTAISALNLDEGTQGTQLISQLKEKLGFEFDIASTSTFNQQTNTVSDSNAIVIGKSLTDRLHISYSIGILQADENVLTLKYLLNKFFSIQVTSSDVGNGIDFLYTHSSDHSNDLF